MGSRYGNGSINLPEKVASLETNFAESFSIVIVSGAIFITASNLVSGSGSSESLYEASATVISPRLIMRSGF